MIYQVIPLKVNHQEVDLTTYVLDNSKEIDLNRRRPAIIICPGGGYEFLSEREAEPIAIKMLSYGFQAFVLNYSVKPNVYPQALEELASAVKLVRENAEKWHVHPDKIIVAGFSAGGHLAASLGVFWQQEFLKERLKDENTKWQPNGLLLSYPVISSGEFGHQGSFEALLSQDYENAKETLSLEKKVTKHTPPTFLWHTLEDGLVPMENSLLFSQALRKQGVPFELHLFPNGGHGLGLATQETAAGGNYGIQEEVSVWPELFAKWVQVNFK